MPTKPRFEVFRPGEQAVVHAMNRCVRRLFLLGKNKKGRDYGRRRRRFERELRKATSGFAIDLLSYAIMENHFHLVLRSRPDIAQEWTDEQVVRQWHKLCPIFHDPKGFPTAEPTDQQLKLVLEDTEKIAKWRTRLSDISWLLKLVSERMARFCNAEDGINGHFWQGRFKAVLLLDEIALLTCSIYVDLNRIKAELDLCLESSDFTSIKRRLQALMIRPSMKGVLAEQVNASAEQASTVTSVVIDPNASESDYIPNALADAHLAPIYIDEKNDPIGSHPSTSGKRCSDKGFLSITFAQYVELLKWTIEQLRNKQKGHTLSPTPPVMAQLGQTTETWLNMVTRFTELFFLAAGKPESVDSHRSCKSGKRFNMPQKTREMLSA